ncbi:MAG: repair protein recO [Crocinitomicaceae bacterium]|jgi:DNA repair protein RecO (recombination protein O)|nr:repair protein recO [Crocinitomicaceae bacterium]
MKCLTKFSRKCFIFGAKAAFLKKTDIGIILNRISYSETSVVVKCFTQEHGLKAFLVQGGKKKYSSALQVMMPVEFTFYQKKDELAKMYDPAQVLNLNEVLFHPLKSSYLFFQSEILVQCLKEGQIDGNLFRFAMEELVWLNLHDNHANYLLSWLLELCNILGFFPNVIDPSAWEFDLQNGEIGSGLVRTSQCVSSPEIRVLSQLLLSEKEARLKLQIPKESRRFLLNLLLDYFKIHVSGFKTPKSLEVYQVIWYE